MEIFSQTSSAVDAINEIVNSLEKELVDFLGEEGFRELIYTIRTIMDLVKAPTTLTSYFEAKNRINELIEVFSKIRDKIDLSKRVNLLIVLDRPRELQLDLMALTALLKAMVVRSITNILRPDLLEVMKKYLVKELETTKNLLKASTAEKEMKDLVSKIIDINTIEVEKRANEYIKKVREEISKTDIVKEKLGLVPEEFRGIIEKQLIPVIALLYKHNEEYNIEYCGESEFMQPLSFETILLNAERIHGQRIEELKRHMDFLAKLLKPDIDIDYCVHAIYTDNRTFYPKNKCKYYDLSEKVLVIETQTLKNYLKNKYIETLMEADITETLEEIENNNGDPVKLVSFISLATITRQKGKHIIDHEILMKGVEKNIRMLLETVVEPKTAEYLTKTILGEIGEKIMEVIEKTLQENQPTWAKILKHMYSGHSCSTTKTILITNQLKQILQSHLETQRIKLTTALQEAIKNLKDLKEKVERVIALEEILEKEEYEDTEKCIKALKDLIDKKQVIVLKNRCITTPALDEETKEKLEEEKEKTIKQIREKVRETMRI